MGMMFNRAASRAKWRCFFSRINGRSTQLLPLKSMNGNNKNRLPGIQQILTDEIIGSEGRCNDFDNQFLPLQTHNRNRWIGIAMAQFKQVTLPPVLLISTDRGYFVRDGHHRLSVARVFGQQAIEAIVV